MTRIYNKNKVKLSVFVVTNFDWNIVKKDKYKE